MSSVDNGITLFEITFSGQFHQWTKALIMLYLCPLMTLHAECYYNIIRDNIQREMSSEDKGITLLEITFSVQCHQWTKV